MSHQAIAPLRGVPLLDDKGIPTHRFIQWIETITGSVKPGDVHELSNGIRALIEDPSLRQRLGQAARQRVLKDYTWAKHTSRIVHKLEEMYL